MLSIQVLCHIVDLKHDFDIRWKIVLFTLENIGTCVEITLYYFHCIVLHKVKVFMDYIQGLVQFNIIVDFYIDDSILALNFEDCKTVKGRSQ